MSGTPAVLQFGSVETPFGAMRIACDETSLVALALPGEDEEQFVRGLRGTVRVAPAERQANVVARVASELEAYFAGELRSFSTPLAPRGSPFQRRVWAAVCDVPYGETRSYGAVAAGIGRPSAARAVGHANGANPLPVVVPCHRLVGHDGGLVRYGRHDGGLEMKRWLIEHEHRHAGCT